jgi:5'-deoxynucleotidase
MYGFLAMALRQSNITRWPTMRCANPETVLEHSAIVAILAMLVIQYAKADGDDLDESIIMYHALMHDAQEIICGDTITPTKRANPTIHSEFQKIEAAATQQMVQSAPPFMRDFLARAFEPGGREQKLVKACDTYAAYIKCRLEVAAGNKAEFGDALERMEELVHQMVETIPEIGRLHADFYYGIGLSVDSLLNLSNK